MNKIFYESTSDSRGARVVTNMPGMTCSRCSIPIEPNHVHFCGDMHPFFSARVRGRDYYAIDAESRLARAKTFHEVQCVRALELPHLQKTVRNFIARRFRAFEKAAQ